MAIVKDPEGIEISILLDMVDFKDLNVLEIGCGDGRLTWRYAEYAAHVTGLDPISEDIEKARANLPDSLLGLVTFVDSSIEEFDASRSGHRFDVAIYSWSL